VTGVDGGPDDASAGPQRVIATVAKDMSVQFELSQERVSPQVEVLAVGGEVDIFTAPEIRRAAISAIDDGAIHIVLDLTATSFLDSTGLGMIIGLSKRVRPAGGDIVIVNVDEGIARTFEITGLDEIFRICATRAEALDAELG